jgi:hypothetical protein
VRRENAESPPCPFPKPRFKKLLAFLEESEVEVEVKPALGENK